jgi:hypothetical protein
MSPEWFRPNGWFSIVCAKVMLTLILQATTTDTATSSRINCNFGITEFLLHKNGNIVLRSTGGTAAAICGYGNTDCDYRCDYLCHVTYCVV